MKLAGYAGPTDMAVLTVYNDEQSSSEICVGTGPTLNVRNSHCLQAGESDNFQGGEDTTTVYIRANADGKINVDFRPR